MNRFGDIDCSFQRLPPVYGFRSAPLISLENALERIESQIDQLPYYIKIAKKHCRYPNEHGLSKDQSASIYIYTMEWGETTLYRVLNQALRSENRDALKIWFPYLKLFDTGLDLLPTVKESVWRGVPLDIGKNFLKGQIFTWWAVSSCSSSVNIIEQFLQNKNNSTLFMIEVVNGKKVSGYTEYEKEDEIILRIGTEFRVKADPLKRADGSYTVHLIELKDDDEDADDNSQVLATSMKSLDVTSKSSHKQTSSINFENIPQTQNNNLQLEEHIRHDAFGTDHRDSKADIPVDQKTENQKSVSHPPLTCKGRQCLVCGRCCDWYYNGRPDDWEWIRKFRDWDQNTVQRWRSGDYHNKFKLHKHAKCDRSIYYTASYFVRFITAGAFDGSHLVGHLCVCDSPKPAK